MDFVSSSSHEQYSSFVEGETDFDPSAHTCFSRFLAFKNKLSLGLECKLCTFDRIKKRCPTSSTFNLEASRILFLISGDKSCKVIQIVQLIFFGADPNFVAPESLETPLHLVAANGLSNCAQCLLQFGANINAIDKSGQTPLITACKSNNSNSNTVKVLANTSNINLNFVDKMGKTALDYASSRNDIRSVRFLLLSGASLIHDDVLPPIDTQLLSDLSQLLLENTVTGNEVNDNVEVLNEEEKEEEKREEKEDEIEEHKEDSEIINNIAHITSTPQQQQQQPNTKSIPQTYHTPQAQKQQKLPQKSIYSLVSELIQKSSTVPYGIDLEERLIRCLDYHSSTLTLQFHRLQTQNDQIIIVKMIAYRLIEVERMDIKVTPLGPPLEIVIEVPHETTDTTKFWKQPDRDKRVQIRQERKVKRVQQLVATGRGGGRKTIQQQEEEANWIKKKVELQQRVDKQYNVEINLKGMFK